METPSHLPETNETPQHPFFISYDGILSELMNWDDKKLARFASASNLKAEAITIRRGYERSQNDYEELNDTLVFKKITDMRSLAWRSPSKPDKSVDVVGYREGLPTITINDQIIAERTQKSKEPFNNAFIKEFNKSVMKGLQTMLKEEKTYLTTFAAAWDLFAFGLPSPFLIGGSLLTVEGIKGMFANIESLLRNGISPESILASTAIYFGSGFTIIGAKTFVSTMNILKEYTQENDFLTNMKDYNPTKHVKDYLTGVVYLNLHAKDLVSLKPSVQ